MSAGATYIKACSSLALYGAAGSVGALAALGVTAGLGTTVPLAVSAALAVTATDATKEFIKTIAERFVNMTLEDAKVKGLEDVNHHIAAAIAKGLQDAIGLAFKECDKRDMSTEVLDVLRGSSAYLDKVVKHEKSIERQQFAGSLGLAVDEILFGSGKSADTAVVEALLDVGDSQVLFELPIALVLKAHAQGLPKNELDIVFSIVRKHFNKCLMESVKGFLARSQIATNKFVAINALISREADTKILKGITELQGNIDFQLYLMRKNDQETKLLLDGISQLKNGQTFILKEQKEIKKSIESMMVHQREFRTENRNLHEETHQFLVEALTILRELKL